MARAHKVFLGFGIMTAIYLLLLFSFLPVPFVRPEAAADILPVVPWWLLVSFGSYSLWSLGWGMCTFRDCPEAYEELLKDIDEARNELRALGVSVD